MPYSKEENSIVERANKEVLRYIRDMCYIAKDKSNWSSYLPIAQRIINSLKKDITGYSPSELLYSGAINLNKHLLLEEREIQSHLDPISIDQWLKDKQQFQQQALSIASKRQKDHDIEHVVKFESGSRTEYKKGDLVLKTYPTTSNGANGRPSKLHTNYTGPYTIDAVNGERYDLRSATGRLLSNVSVHLLKPYVYDASRQNPSDEALHDTESYVVERIIRHIGSFTKKKSLKVEVKWCGYVDTRGRMSCIMKLCMNICVSMVWRDTFQSLLHKESLIR